MRIIKNPLKTIKFQDLCIGEIGYLKEYDEFILAIEDVTIISKIGRQEIKGNALLLSDYTIVYVEEDTKIIACTSTLTINCDKE